MWISAGFFVFLASAGAINSAPSSDVSERSSRVVNGYEINISEIPYHAGLRRKVSTGWAYTCGATILSKTAVVTAAHCVTNYESQPSYIRIVVGSSYRLSGGRTYSVKKITVHESYDADYLLNDIALLTTYITINFSSTVNSINFAKSDIKLPSGTEALVSGFGLTENGSPSSVLLAAKVNIVDQATCARAYIRITNISAGMICANATNPPRDACQGDSGGPLVVKGVLVGIVSWGEGCAYSNYPGVYTRVSEYYNWISKKL